MSNTERAANLPAIIRGTRDTFTDLARRHQVPDFTFEREASFAIQILNESSYLQRVALGNPDSLKQAVINVAATGLSLSPVHGLAYLVPRKSKDGGQKVCLDISYKGWVALATRNGVLVWVKAEVVYQNDKFEYRGVNQEPYHAFDPFKERGELIGGYVIAKMTTGDYLVDFMSIREIHGIRNRSEAWKAFLDKKVKETPWNSDEVEMAKKTLIKRGRKSWPESVAKSIDSAIEVSNEDERIDFSSTAAVALESSGKKREGLEIIRELLTNLHRSEENYVAHLTRVNNRTITALADLTDLEVDQAVTFLQTLSDRQAANAAKPKEEKKNENAG